ncbi:hypothetical protein U3516DRAFT_483637, partial [Neocallimastix sp. 'constans']
ITTKIEICNGCNYVIPGNIIDRILFNGEGRFLLEIQNNKIDEFYQFNNNKMLYLSDIGQDINRFMAQNLVENIKVHVSLNNINNDRIIFLRDMNNFIAQYLIENVN